MPFDLLGAGDRERPLFWTPDGPISGSQVLRRAAALAERLPDRRAASLVYERRDRFVTALLSLWLRRQTAVLPANVAMRHIHRMRQTYPEFYFLADSPVETGDPDFLLVDDTTAELTDTAPTEPFSADFDALCIFTSGSTGQPTANFKSWEVLSSSAGALAAMIGLDNFEAPSIVATVPSHHMYGIEFTAVAVLYAGAAVHCERAVYPADVARCLQDIPPPRLLVTTPFHLRALIESQINIPPVSRIISATAPLDANFAASIENRFGAPVHEIYGFTELGSVAGRRTVAGDEWTLRDDLVTADDQGTLSVEYRKSGLRIPFPDFIEVVDARHILLRNRLQDVINVAGNRASLAGLSVQLTGIEGVEDGVFFLPSPDAGQGTISRLSAVVVSPSLTSGQIRQRLRERIEPAFLPRHIFLVDELPRNETGKILQERLNSLITSRLKKNKTPR